MKIDRLYENTDIIVVNKISGIHSHPLKKNDTTTMLHLLAAVKPCVLDIMNPDKPLEGGLIHRLDCGTSGALAFALNRKAYDATRKTWKDPAAVKIYLAWVHGKCKLKGKLCGFMSHSEKSKRKMVFRFKESGHAKSWKVTTEFMPVNVAFHDGKIYTLMLVRIHTGVTHQIRSQLATLGFPVVGDLLYQHEKPVKEKLIEKNMQELKPSTNEFFLKLKKSIPHCGSAAPDESKLDKNQFLLHSFYLKTPAVHGDPAGVLASGVLASGIMAPTPDHFGLKGSD